MASSLFNMHMIFSSRSQLSPLLTQNKEKKMTHEFILDMIKDGTSRNNKFTFQIANCNVLLIM